MASEACLKSGFASWISPLYGMRLPLSRLPVVNLSASRKLRRNSITFPLVLVHGGSSHEFPSKPTWFGRHVLNAREDEDQGPSSSESKNLFKNDQTEITGLKTTLYRVQDGVQIFFAVLFWMSLFFWASAWDSRNGGRPSKGPPFRR